VGTRDADSDHGRRAVKYVLIFINAGCVFGLIVAPGLVVASLCNPLFVFSSKFSIYLSLNYVQFENWSEIKVSTIICAQQMSDSVVYHKLILTLCVYLLFKRSICFYNFFVLYRHLFFFDTFDKVVPVV
jgi:hypothetical protein